MGDRSRGLIELLGPAYSPVWNKSTGRETCLATLTMTNNDTYSSEGSRESQEVKEGFSEIGGLWLAYSLSGRTTWG
jgi:hypothetical protein